MRRVAICLFLFSYFSSSVVTNQYRAKRAAQRVLRPAVAQNIQVGDGNSVSLEDHYPRYREAKKGVFEFHFRSVASVDLPAVIGKYEFALFQLYWETHHSVSILAVRAPPLQAQPV